MVKLINPPAEINVQEYPGGFISDGHGAFCIFSCKTFREMLTEMQRRGWLRWNGMKVLRFEGDFLPVVDSVHGGQMALAIPGGGWSFFAE